jgi:hypothetical protein
MKTEKQEKRIDYISFILCMIVALSMMALLGYHTLKAKPVEPKKQTMMSRVSDSLIFQITKIDGIEGAEDETGFKITYAISDSTSIEIFTSTMEGDYLIYNLDCLSLYEQFNDTEAIDELESYFINNSHIDYLDNPWFQGFTWTWDACPVFLYPNP